MKRIRGVKTKRKRIVKDAEESANSKVEEAQNNFRYIHSGSVMLNLACSDKWDGGEGKGKMSNTIGDSSAGKTAKELCKLAHCANNSEFDNYKLIYDDVESALEFNIKHLCGEKAFERITAPAYDDEGNPIYSNTIQEWHNYIEKLFDDEQPFIYVLDSFDALTSKDELAKDEKNRKDILAGRKIKGSYGDGKAKEMSKIMRIIVKRLKKTDSHITVISQTRDKLDAMMFEEKKIRSGGNALRFYSCHETWLAVKKKIKSRDRQIGSDVRVRLKKNKMTGKLRQVEFPLYYDYGIDDIQSCIDFLIEEKIWKIKKGRVMSDIKGLPSGSVGDIITYIERRGIEEKLFKRTEEAWLKIEESLKLDRKPKFK